MYVKNTKKYNFKSYFKLMQMYRIKKYIEMTKTKVFKYLDHDGTFKVIVTTKA